MDYLDPVKKKAHKQRLAVGYLLFGIVIAIVTTILVFAANGYDIDPETGEVIQNGLVYVDSRPGSAEVYLNDQKQRGTTDARLVIPSGAYDVILKKDGYRDWRRSVIVEGGSLHKLTYARFIPNELRTEKNVSLRPGATSALQSINRKWLAVAHADTPLSISLVNIEAPPYQISSLDIPKVLVSNTATGVLEIVEWAGNNRHMLATYTLGTDVSYLLIDREKPEESKNLTILFSDKTLEVAFLDRDSDRFVLYDPETLTLTKASLDKKDDQPFVTEVLDHAFFGEDWVLYLKKSEKPGFVSAHFKHGKNDIVLKDFQESSEYHLELAKLSGAPIMGVLSPTEGRAIVYHDPERYLRDNKESRLPIATAVLRVAEPKGLSMSADATIILAYGSQQFASHEFEADRTYSFALNSTFSEDSLLQWIDGQHIVYDSGGKQFIADFDGSNQQELVDAIATIGSFTNENISSLITLRDTEESGVLVPSVHTTSLVVE